MDRRKLSPIASELEDEGRLVIAKSVVPTGVRPGEGSMEARIAEIGAAVLGVQVETVTLNVSFAWMGGDSIKYIRLLMMLRREGLPVTDTSLTAASSLNTIVSNIRVARARHSLEVTWTSFDHSVTTVGAVTWYEDYAILVLPASKTDPFRLGAPLVVPKVGGIECPYVSLKAICSAQRPAAAPVFAINDGFQPLTRTFFLSILRLALERLGLQPSEYAGHSFRRGAATWAASAGVDSSTIQLLGRWSSDCYRRYIDRSALERRSMVASALFSVREGPLVPSSLSWRDPVL